MDTAVPLKNEVLLHDDYIEVIWVGEQTLDKVKASSTLTQSYSKELESKGLPVLLMLKIIDHPMSANWKAYKEILKIFDAVSFSRVVITGNLPPILATLVTGVINSFNSDFEICHIEDEIEALAWLKITDAFTASQQMG